MPQSVEQWKESTRALNQPVQRESGGAAARLVAVAATVLLISFLVISRSSAAVNAEATTTGNRFSRGEIVLSDDDSGATMFQLPALAPGRPHRNCIRVKYSGNVFPVEIGLRTRGGGALAADLLAEVSVGSGGTFDDCTGFVPSAQIFDGTLADLLSGHGPQDPALRAFQPSSVGEERTFRFTFVLDPDATDQGETANADFIWVARY